MGPMGSCRPVGAWAPMDICIYIYTSVYPIDFNRFFNGFLIKLDITIEFAIKNSIDSWTQNEFLEKLIFLSFFNAGGPLEPARRLWGHQGSILNRYKKI